MKTSVLGVKAIAKREGTVLRVYLDSKKLPTAGVGHLLTSAEKVAMPVGTKITQKQSDDWLSQDLKDAEDAVNSLNVALKANEFDALVSLTFNIGVAGFLRSTVAKRLKAGDHKGAAEAILLWNKPPEIQGRRRTEYNQFLNPYKDSAAAPLNTQIPATGNTSVISEPDNQSPPPIQIEQTNTETKQEDGVVKQEQTTLTTPKGDPPTATPTQVTTRGPLAMWLFSGGGLMTIGTAVWGIIQANLGAVAVGILCFTFLVCIIIFRHAITDAIRMQTAADPDKKNVT